MNIKKILFTALLSAGCFTASAQNAPADSVDAFNHHWYVQAQVGGQYTLGERSFGDLMSANMQVAAGYQFTPVWGLRLAFDFWQSKGGSDVKMLNKEYGWKYNYVAPTLDVTCDLTNLFGGDKKRICNVGILAGVGANIAWNNDEAISVQKQYNHDFATQFPHIAATGAAESMEYLWDDTQARAVARFGAYCDFHVSKRVDLGLELNANTLSDHYNSKKAGNSDWYFNGLAGVKVHLGKLTKKAKKESPCGQIVVEKIVEKIVEKPVEKIIYKEPEAPKREPLRRDIFFVICGSTVSSAEMPKVEEVAAYLNKYADAKVSITGYADKGTGNAKLNVGYARKRAQMVADLLTKKYGISSSRIIVDSKGDTVQPYEQNDLNRVSICIAE